MSALPAATVSPDLAPAAALSAAAAPTPASAGLARLHTWPWPLPALLAWGVAWLGASVTLALGVGAPFALAWGAMLSISVSIGWPGVCRWRRGLMLAGYPLAVVASGLAVGVPPWAWLLPALVLVAVYPLHAWRDAPLYPTPPRALAGLAASVPLPLGARVLDAGCGLGHGLAALQREWPHARVEGVEWSRPLAWVARWRHRDGRVRRADMWRTGWGGYQVVYLFQRPESMARAWAKACAEMKPGAFLVSLDFPVPGVAPLRQLQRLGAQSVWVYRVPAAAAALARPRSPRPATRLAEPAALAATSPQVNAWTQATHQALRQAQTRAQGALTQAPPRRRGLRLPPAAAPVAAPLN